MNPRSAAGPHALQNTHNQKGEAKTHAKRTRALDQIADQHPDQAKWWGAWGSNPEPTD